VIMYCHHDFGRFVLASYREAFQVSDPHSST